MAAGRGFSKKDEDKTKYLQINQDLKEEKLRPIYLLYGSENYLKRSYLRSFREKFGGKDSMNVQLFEGNADPDEIISVLDTMPFFADSRLVILRDTDYCKKTAPEKLCAYLEKLPETSHLLIVVNEVDKRNKLYKLIEKQGGAFELSEQEDRMLAAWGGKYLARAGKKIRPSTMQEILTKCGSSMDRISGELEKLIAYTGEREVIEDEDVALLCTQNVEDRVFDMITELSLGHTEKAMRYYSDLLTLQEAPMKILALMRRNFNQLLLAKECVRQGLPRAESAKYLGVAPFVVQRLTEQAKHYTTESLEHYIARCLDYDEAIKNGNLSDRLAVELLLSA